MLDMLTQWYQRRFSDPEAIALLVILLGGFGIIYFFSGILAPLLVAIVLAYLLEWPTSKLQQIGCSRLWAVCLIMILFCGLALWAILVMAPTVWQQAVTLLSDLPGMFTRFHEQALLLPARYPALVDAGIIDVVMENLRGKISNFGSSVIKHSLASLLGLVTLAVYLILVPLMIFFLLKDKQQMFQAVNRILPRNRSLAAEVWQEMNQQITNYIRGKVLEIVIVGVCAYLVFWLLGLRYTLLLSVIVGFSVLIPYVGATLATLPVVVVALFQWGLGPDFWSVLIAYLILQALDGNVLAPLLFSEAVDIHPLIVILSVIVFGGLWGFWGVFFAIPLATLVKAVMNAWPDNAVSGDPS